LKQQQKQIETMIMEKENQIKMQLTTTERALAGKYVITWQNVVTHRFDTTALKESDINIYNKYLKETNTRRLTINERKENHDNFNA
jgi:predicted phage-related endonuclease